MQCGDPASCEKSPRYWHWRWGRNRQHHINAIIIYCSPIYKCKQIQQRKNRHESKVNFPREFTLGGILKWRKQRIMSRAFFGVGRLFLAGICVVWSIIKSWDSSNWTSPVRQLWQPSVALRICISAYLSASSFSILLNCTYTIWAAAKFEVKEKLCKNKEGKKEKKEDQLTNKYSFPRVRIRTISLSTSEAPAWNFPFFFFFLFAHVSHAMAEQPRVNTTAIVIISSWKSCQASCSQASAASS